MILNLIKNESSNNTIGKTLVDGPYLTINLKASVDIVSPEIILSTMVGVNYLDYNYAHIPDLGRYYFITSIDSVNAKLWKLTLQCDVIETYKSDIKLCNSRFMRNLKSGDDHVSGIEYSTDKEVTKYNSDFTMPTNEHTNILTVVEGGAL